MLKSFPTLQHMMPQVDLQEIMDYLASTDERRTYPLWQQEECLCFVARGREYRSEFHLNPSHEFQFSIKGDLNLHYRTADNKEHVAVVPEGHCLYQPPMVPHSPRFAPDAFQLVIERKRRPGEIDRFHWFCGKCDHRIHEETFIVSDYGVDPVSRAYDNYFNSLAFRTCRQCGTVAPGR